MALRVIRMPPPPALEKAPSAGSRPPPQLWRGFGCPWCEAFRFHQRFGLGYCALEQPGEVVSLIEGGGVALPHSDGADPIVRTSVAPSSIWACRNQEFGRSTPFSFADCT